MRRTVIGGAVVIALVAVLGFTSGFRPAASSRVTPSEVGVEPTTDAPFEFGSVMDTQSFR